MRLIARDGFEAMTMRAVASEAGLSYGSLFHYFDSKDDLLLHAVRYSMREQTRRANAYSSRFRGLKALEQLVSDDVLSNESTRDDWLLWLAFLYRAALQERFAAMHEELIDGWLERFRTLLAEARDRGEIRADVDVELEAVSLWVFSAGLGQQGLLHPGQVPASRQKRLIRAYLDRLRPG